MPKPTPTPPGHAADSESDASLRLALRPKEAARALGIGERLLWSMTNQGVIPHLKIGKATLYPVDVLRDWLARQSKGGSR